MMDLADLRTKRRPLGKTAYVQRVKGVIRSQKAQQAAKKFAARFRTTCKQVFDRDGAAADNLWVHSELAYVIAHVSTTRISSNDDLSLLEAYSIYSHANGKRMKNTCAIFKGLRHGRARPRAEFPLEAKSLGFFSKGTRARNYT